MIKRFVKKYINENPRNNKMYYVVLENRIKEDSCLLESLFTETQFLNADAKIKERIFYIINDIKEIQGFCLICGSPTKFFRISEGYEKYCSKKCRNQNPNLIEHISSGLKKYHNNLTDDKKKAIQDKIDETNMRIRGVKRPAQNKEIMDKIESTNLKLYGAKNIFLLDETKLKYKESMIEKYGVDHISKTDGFKKKISESIQKYSLDYLRNKYKELDILGYKDRVVTIKCHKCSHTYDINSHLLHERMMIFKNNPCLKCNRLNYRKNMENDFIDFILSLTDEEYLRGKRKELGGKEIDISFPRLKLGFEFNGVYWHSMENPRMSINYHQNKKDLSLSKGIDLILIYEDEWKYKREIVESIIKNKFFLNEKIYARKCIIKKVNKNDKDIFLKENHIQGTAISSMNYGLYRDDILVAIMTFSGLRRAVGNSKKDGSYEMIRFCNKIGTHVIGGASRLFNAFIRDNDPNHIISFANYDRSCGDLYYKLGFILDKKTKPGYYYVVNGRREHRFNYRKDILVKLGYDSKKTESEIMSELGYWKIYDSGNLKFIWKKPH